MREKKRPAAWKLRAAAPCYTGAMMDEQEFRRAAESALESLKRHLIEREEEADAGFEVEEQNGVLNVLFEDPPGKFVITPNTPVRQIWISALSTSFKLDWDTATAAFEVEEQNGVLNVLFEEPAGKFVITPNTPVRQIWISALSTSFKLDWDATNSAFILPRSGEKLIPLVDRLIQDRQEG